MSLIKIKSLLLLTALFAVNITFAQEENETIGSETVVVVKPYTPSVSDAFKVKAVPVLNDSISLAKKRIIYKIFSVPVASTFTPAKGTAAKVEKAKPIKVYDNYATLGAGNYTSALAEFFTNFEIDRGQNLGLKFQHNSAQGDIDGVLLDHQYYDTRLGLDFTSRDRDLSYSIGGEGFHQQYNWYGFPESIPVNNATLNRTDPVQNYYGGGLRATINPNEGVFNSARFYLNYFADSHNSAEFNVFLKPQLEFEIAEELITTDVTVDYVNGSFDQNYLGTNDLAYSHLNLGLTPRILILRDDLELNVGASVFYNLDSENSDSDIFVYPNINASYRLSGDYAIAYAGLNGELQQNTYKGYTEENPFVSPTLFIAPTDKQYEGKLGLKGKLTETFSYDIRGSYSNAKNSPLFKSNPSLYSIQVDFEDYQYGNSFDVVYDRVTTFGFRGELNYDLNQNVRLGVNAEYFSYDTENEAEAWNLPEFKAALLADFNITPKLTATTRLFYVGEREANVSLFSTPNNLVENTRTLDGYVDANLQLDYNINNQLSFFLKGNNLFGDTYERWVNFPVYGLQVLGGATYKFDW